jgi:N-acetylmuramoyl-L-alanine amidase
MTNIFYLLILLFLITSCAINPYKSTEKSYQSQLKTLRNTISKTDTIGLGNNQKSEWISTVNFNLRKPNFIIIHHTAQDSIQQTIKTFTIERTQVSAHYVIGDNGKVVQMLNDYLRAWHAGSATWGKTTDVNSASIGIELDNNGFEPFSEAQINSLLKLLEKLKKQYNIPTQNIIGHSDIAPTRKNDPSIFFPWKLLAEKGFGVFPTTFLETAPPEFNAEFALKIIGYNTKNLPDVIKSFKRHYMLLEDDFLDQNTKNTIYSVFLKQ